MSSMGKSAISDGTGHHHHHDHSWHRNLDIRGKTGLQQVASAGSLSPGCPYPAYRLEELHGWVRGLPRGGIRDGIRVGGRDRDRSRSRRCGRGRLWSRIRRRAVDARRNNDVPHVRASVAADARARVPGRRRARRPARRPGRGPAPDFPIWSRLDLGSKFGSGLSVGLGLRTEPAYPYTTGPGSALGVGLGFSFAVMLTVGLAVLLAYASSCVRYTIGQACAATRRRLPPRLSRFLFWAHESGLLRISGATYQFRHRELQDWLSARPAPQTCPPDADGELAPLPARTTLSSHQ
jgi:hypothetical protein